MKFTVKFTYTTKVGHAERVFPCRYHTDAASSIDALAKVRKALGDMSVVEFEGVVEGWVQ